MAEVAETGNDKVSPLKAYADKLQADIVAKKGDNTEAGKFSKQYTDFLTLLTAQLQNQDPLDPMDSHEFTNQLVLFSGVEQQIKQGDQLTSLLETEKNSASILQSLLTTFGKGNVADANSFIGRSVEFETKNFELTETGAIIPYQLPFNADRVLATVKSLDGNLIDTFDLGATEAGINDFVWLGNNKNGGTQLPGTYQVEIFTTGADGKRVDLKRFLEQERIIGVEISDKGYNMVTNHHKFPIEDIKSVRE